MYKISPSILAADFSRLGEEIEKVDKAGAEYIHIDVMDGAFVPSISYGMPVIASIRKTTKKVFDVHLMIEEPIRYIEDFKNVGADLIMVHVEACSDIEKTIDAINNLGLKSGVAVKPETPVSSIYKVIEKVDMILVMTVNPGFGGQKYIDDCTKKVSELRKKLDEMGLDTDIQVDGGITLDNIEKPLRAGANVFVAGSSVYKNDVEKNVKAFKEVFKRYE